MNTKTELVEYPLFAGRRYKWKLLSCVQIFVTPWTVALSGSPVHGDSPGKDTVVGCHILLQEIFLTQGSNSGLWHCKWILYQLRHQGSPRILEWLACLISRGFSRPRNRTRVSCIAGGFFNNWATRKAPKRYQFSSVTQLCPALCNPMDCSTLGFPVHYQLPEFTRTHVHWVSEAIQPSPPLSSPSLPTFNLSQH